MESVLIAFSGGVDSTFLLAVTHEVLEDRCYAFTALSETYTEEEKVMAQRFCKEKGIKHFMVKTGHLKNTNFVKNPENRCYFCKVEIFSEAYKVANSYGIRWIADATNFDDLSDYRPGRIACEELGVRSPLVEAELTKGEIRELSKRIELPTWNMPQNACLSSRFEYGLEITPERLKMVYEGEKFLREKGFSIVRLRFHRGDVARIETEKEGIKRFSSSQLCSEVRIFLKNLGFKRVLLDIEGYRRGSMNDGIKKKGIYREVIEI